MSTPVWSRLLTGRLAVNVAVVAFAALTYLALVVGLGRLLGLPADRPSTVLSVVATTVVAVGLPQVRRRFRQVAPAKTRWSRSPASCRMRCRPMRCCPGPFEAVAEATSAGAAEIRVRSSGADPVVTRWPPAQPPIDDVEPGVVVWPIVSHAARIGELVLRPRLTRSGRPRRFPQAERRLLDAFVGRAGLTVENVQLRAALNREVAVAARRAEEVRASRRRVVEAADAERHRLARDIHDGAQQHLVALSVSLGLARGQCALQPARAAATLDALAPAVVRTLDQLDDLGRGIYPRALTAGGVAEALLALAAASSPTVIVRLPQPGLRWPSDVEAAVYFTCAEALQNATKHARAGRIEIRLDATADAVSFAVRDDGVGFDPTSDRSRDRTAGDAGPDGGGGRRAGRVRPRPGAVRR